MELTHAFVEGTCEIGRKHAREPFTELARFATVAITFTPVEVDEAAGVNPGYLIHQIVSASA